MLFVSLPRTDSDRLGGLERSFLSVLPRYFGRFPQTVMLGVRLGVAENPLCSRAQRNGKFISLSIHGSTLEVDTIGGKNICGA